MANSEVESYALADAVAKPCLQLVRSRPSTAVCISMLLTIINVLRSTSKITAVDQASLFLAYELRDMLGNLRQINFGAISESDGRQFFFDVPRQDRFETLK